MSLIDINSAIETRELFGNLDDNLKAIEKATGTKIIQRDNKLIFMDGNEELAKTLISEFMAVLEKGEKLDKQKVNYIIEMKAQGVSYKESKVSNDVVCFTHLGKPIKAKTIGQQYYVKSMKEKDIVFGIGPAGTGKTYLAVAMAVNALKNKEVQRIILARPAVEAGESLGFLPGDLQEKVDPYLRPLYDGLFDILGKENAERLKEKEAIEVVPLAYMRGRTLDNSFIILDEAQNTTQEQMKMFLTRMGFNSKVVVTGDKTQIDLPKGKKSGLIEAEKILKSVDEIDFCYLKDTDVVRHELVKRIINAYEEYYKKQ
ncbi:MAG: PhoH family protein [Clostridia bacterium]|nr:PhoH family protein [Clostridia bacterium]